jgi:hypothetical protein
MKNFKGSLVTQSAVRPSAIMLKVMAPFEASTILKGGDKDLNNGF